MATGSVLLLTGPPGSGKTTIAKMLAARVDTSVHIESDSFFHFIVEGYIEPWKPESHEQNKLVMRIVGEAAAAYATGGYFTVVDGILRPGWFYEPLRDHLRGEGIRVSYAILRPALGNALDRVKSRASSERGINESAVEQLWRSFDDLGDLEAHVIDNGDLDPETTVREVEHRLGEGTLDAK